MFKNPTTKKNIVPRGRALITDPITRLSRAVLDHIDSSPAGRGFNEGGLAGHSFSGGGGRKGNSRARTLLSLHMANIVKYLLLGSDRLPKLCFRACFSLYVANNKIFRVIGGPASVKNSLASVNQFRSTSLWPCFPSNLAITPDSMGFINMF